MDILDECWLKDPQYRHSHMEIRICLAFSVGWLGIWNVMPSYSSYAASTIAVPLIKRVQRVTFYPKWCSLHLFLQEFDGICIVFPRAMSCSSLFHHPCLQVFKIQIFDALDLPKNQVIVYTYTGATPSVTLRRLSGVVLGKVAGSILQLALAVKCLGKQDGKRKHMGVSENSGTPKSSILIGFSIINYLFLGTSIFGNPHINMLNQTWGESIKVWMHTVFFFLGWDFEIGFWRTLQFLWFFPAVKAIWGFLISSS